jgi:hypothetical protein
VDADCPAGESCLNGLLAASNVDPANPDEFTRINQINPDLKAPIVDEFILGAEYEVMRNFTVGANLTWRERDKDLHTPLYNIPAFNNTGQLNPLNGGIFYDCVDPANVVSGTLPGTTTPYSEQYCVVSPAGVLLTDQFSRNTMLDNRPDYTQEYQGIEIFATKRLSNRWLLRAFVAFNTWEHAFGGQPLSANWDYGSNQIVGPTFGIDGDPTNTQGGTADDGGQIGYPSAGSGAKDDVWVGSATWQANANFMYQLPYGFSLATNIQAREGYMVPFYHQENIDEIDGFNHNKQIQIGSADGQRYDDIFLMDLKAAKTFQMQGNTAVEVSIEAFNLFNDDTILQNGRRADSVTQFGNVREVLSPRIYRFGATVNF